MAHETDHHRTARSKDGDATGQIIRITWNTATSDLSTKDGSQGIDAKDVTQPSTWSADYTWDSTSGTLTLEKPMQVTEGGGQIAHLVIKSWGSSDLVTPLEWVGPTQGTVYMLFERSGGQNSGPVGGVGGP